MIMKLHEVGRWVKEQRKVRGISTAQLAESLGISLRTLYQIEAGWAIPGTRVLFCLMREFGYDIQPSDSAILPDCEDW